MIRLLSIWGIVLLLTGYAMCFSVYLSRECNLNSTTCILSGYDKEITVLSDPKVEVPFTDVIFKHTRQQWIPLKLFSNVPKLKRLMMYSCTLRSLQEITFSDAANLRSLFLLHNHLTELPEYIFMNLTSIEDIRLNNNYISHIHPTAFVGVNTLRHLELSSNRIHDLTSGAFENLTTLEYLDLSYNSIETIKSDFFANLKRLKTILLNNNNFVTFDTDSLSNFVHLTMLDISNNDIQSINLQSVDTFRAQNCELQHCVINGSVIRARVSNNQLKSISIGDKNSVKEIDVHNNQFETLSDFDGMMNLQKLDVSRNPIKTLNGSNITALLDLPSLQYFSAAYGQLETLVVENFVLLDKLTHLDMSYNHLTYVDVEVLEPLIGLEKLFLQGNQLNSFDYHEFVRTLVNVKEMGIFGNNWTESYLRKMSEALNFNGIKLLARQNQNDAVELLAHQTPSHTHHTVHAKTLEHDAEMMITHAHSSNRDSVIVVTLCMVFVILVLQVLRILKEENWFLLFRQGIRRDVAPTRLNEEESGPL